MTFADVSIVNDREIIVCARFEASASSFEHQSGRGSDGASAATRKLAMDELVALPPDASGDAARQRRDAVDSRLQRGREQAAKRRRGEQRGHYAYG